MQYCRNVLSQSWTVFWNPCSIVGHRDGLQNTRDFCHCLLTGGHHLCSKEFLKWHLSLLNNIPNRGQNIPDLAQQSFCMVSCPPLLWHHLWHHQKSSFFCLSFAAALLSLLHNLVDSGKPSTTLHTRTSPFNKWELDSFFSLQLLPDAPKQPARLSWVYQVNHANGLCSGQLATKP